MIQVLLAEECFDKGEVSLGITVANKITLVRLHHLYFLSILLRSLHDKVGSVHTFQEKI